MFTKFQIFHFHIQTSYLIIRDSIKHCSLNNNGILLPYTVCIIFLNINFNWCYWYKLKLICRIKFFGDKNNTASCKVNICTCMCVPDKCVDIEEQEFLVLRDTAHI